MSTVQSIMSLAAGSAVFLTGISVLVRAIVRNITATRENTTAITETKQILKGFTVTLDQHTIDIAILKDRQDRRHR